MTDNPIDNYNKIVTTVNSVTSDYTFEVDKDNLIVIDTSNNRIGVNTIYPKRSIHISGGNVNNNNGLISPYIHLISGESLDEPTYGGNFRGSIIPDVSFIYGTGGGFKNLNGDTISGYTLGDASHPWDQIWVMSGDFASLNIGSNTLFMNGKPIIGSDEDGNIRFGNSEQNIKINTKFDNDISLQGDLQFLGRPGQSSKITSDTNIIIDPSGIGDNTGLVTIMGNLLVLGKQTTISSESLEISDNIITLNKGYNNSGPNNFTSGIEVENDTNNKPQLLWVNDANSWKFIKSNNNELLNLELNDLSVNGNIISHIKPPNNQSLNLGTESNNWNKAYLNELNVLKSNGSNQKFTINHSGDEAKIEFVKNGSTAAASTIKIISKVEFVEPPTFPGGAAATTQNIGGGNIYDTPIGYDTNDIAIGEKANFTTTTTQDLIVRNSINFYDSSGLTFDQSLLDRLSRIERFLTSKYTDFDTFT
jgi:hypothetical protein